MFGVGWRSALLISKSLEFSLAGSKEGNARYSSSDIASLKLQSKAVKHVQKAKEKQLASSCVWSWYWGNPLVA